MTFQGNNTTVADTAFEGCDNIGNVYFPNDLPKQEYAFGNSQPTINVGRNPYPETWGGYPVVDAYANSILARPEIQSLQNEVAALSNDLRTLLALLGETGSASQVLTKGEDGSYAWQNADALGSEVMEIKLEAGWNLVAMPGRVAFDESTEALLKNIEIFTFDKKTKVYQPSEGLEPLASYWMRAPEPCTIHFLVIAETP